MTTALFFSIIGLALLDSLNPSLFVTQFYLLTTERPLPRILSYIAGVIVINLGAGLLVLAGFQVVFAELISQISSSLWWTLELLVGIGLIVVGLWMRRKKTTSAAVQQPRSLRPIHTFLLGMAITLQEVTTAAPYLVAIERISQAELPTLNNLLMLVVYNAIYVAPLLAVVGTFLTAGTPLLHRLDGINHAINRWLPRLVTYLCLLLGSVLTIDAMFSMP